MLKTITTGWNGFGSKGYSKSKMKRNILFTILMAAFTLLACEDDLKEDEGELTEAVVLGRDFSKWLCGGGWFIATSTDTVTVQQIPNEEIMSVLAGNSFTADTPLSVNVRFSEHPTSTCATEFERVKEIEEITLRND